MRTVTLSLISHTNVGKTTLARTLLRREVGEVRDQAHVTEVSEAYVLIETANERLQLWDTPGFGDTARLMRRLRAERRPLGWLLHQVWDRVADRPLYCSQRAVHNVQNDADVVLYLVNAAEEPEDAGYIPLELELLAWIGKPVLMLLNQVGRGGDLLLERWRTYADRFAVVQDVLSLDAFTRSWIDEVRLLRRVVPALPDEQREPMRRLTEAWHERNRELFRQACRATATYLVETAADQADAEERDGATDGTLGRLTSALRWKTIDKQRAMQQLNQRLDERTERLMLELLELHGLAGSSAAPIERSLQEFQVEGGLPWDEKSGALAGAVLSGALGGLAADLLSGGLSLGGGMIAGGILGALGGSGLAKGYRLISGDKRPSVRWTPGFLRQLRGQAMLRYLAVAHFGRGRGEYRDVEHPRHWKQAVTTSLEHGGAGMERWVIPAAGEAADAAERWAAHLETELEAILDGDRAGSSRPT